MRRKEKEITNPELISEIIRGSDVCRLGLAKDNTPYVVPLSFGYDGDAIYFHTARKGRKIRYMQANGKVCFEFERGVRPLPDPANPCEWTFSFQTVIGYGTIHELETVDEKAHGLNQIVTHYGAHYSGQEGAFGEASLAKIRVWKVTIETLSGKQSKDKATI
jgi:nitroimidazol reductase NimA-like FMN-containing flavoprotein (pyridoxamine 5'-phosphate oxidase superfamily)